MMGINNMIGSCNWQDTLMISWIANYVNYVVDDAVADNANYAAAADDDGVLNK